MFGTPSSIAVSCEFLAVAAAAGPLILVPIGFVHQQRYWPDEARHFWHSDVFCPFLAVKCVAYSKSQLSLTQQLDETVTQPLIISVFGLQIQNGAPK